MKPNCKYMEGEEFKARQGSFEFFCQWAHDFVLNFRKECRAGWGALFKAKAKHVEQLEFIFEQIKYITEWAEWTPFKNRELFA